MYHQNIFPVVSNKCVTGQTKITGVCIPAVWHEQHLYQALIEEYIKGSVEKGVK